MDFNINEIRRLTRDSKPDAELKKAANARENEAERARREIQETERQNAALGEAVRKVLERVKSAASDGESSLVVKDFWSGQVKAGGRTLFKGWKGSLGCGDLALDSDRKLYRELEKHGLQNLIRLNQTGYRGDGDWRWWVSW